MWYRCECWSALMLTVSRILIIRAKIWILLRYTTSVPIHRQPLKEFCVVNQSVGKKLTHAQIGCGLGRHLSGHRYGGCSVLSFDMHTEIFYDTPAPDFCSDYETSRKHCVMLCDFTAIAVCNGWGVCDNFDMWYYSNMAIRILGLNFCPLDHVQHHLRSL